MSRRILFAYPEVSPLFPNGGIGSYVFEASHLLAKAGWAVDVLTDSRYAPDITRQDVRMAAANYRRAGVHLIDLDRNPTDVCSWPSADIQRAELYARHVARLHAQRGYDLIEFPDYRAPGFFLVRSKRTTEGFANTRLVAHLHASTEDITNWQEGLLVDRQDFHARYMEEYVRKYADIVLSPTEYLLSAVRPTQEMFEKRLFRSGYPLSLPQPGVQARSTSVRTTGITIACISRLERRKGQDLMATAIRSLAERGESDRNVRFVFCGKDATDVSPDLSMARRVRTVLDGVTGWSIVAPKSRHELQNWLARSVDVCVVPSRVDNYPNAILEAARAGCAIVCSDAGGMPEVLRDYAIDAHVFASGNAEALATAIRQAIEQIASQPRIREGLAEAFEEKRRERCAQTLTTYEDMARSETSPNELRRLDPGAVSVVVASPVVNAQVVASVDAAFQSRHRDFEIVVATNESQPAEGLRLLNGLKAVFTELRVVEGSRGTRAELLNLGVSSARGDLVVPVHAGDRLLPDLLERCSVALARRPRLAYIATYARDEQGSTCPQPRWPLLLPQPLGPVEPLMLFEDPVGAPVVMFRRAALHSVGGFSTSLTGFEDWDVWLRLHDHGFEGDVIPEVHAVSGQLGVRKAIPVDSFQSIAVQQLLLRQHRRLAERCALAIAGIVLHEHSTRTRGPGGDAAHNLEQAWTYLKSGLVKLSRESRDPLLPSGRWAKKIARQIEDLVAISEAPERARPQ